MKRRVLTVMISVLALGLLMAPTVVAETPDRDPHMLVADGDGLAMLLGKGIIDLTGNGILWVKADKNATVDVSGYGRKEDFADGWRQYSGFNGTAHIEAHRMHVVLAGVDIHLEARGRGRVFLWGHGTRQHQDETGQWSTRVLGAALTLSEPRAR